MENTIQEIVCPVCLRQDARNIGTKNSCTIYRSNSCGLIFAWPIPRNTSTIYEEDYFQGAERGFGYSDYDRDKEPQRSALEKILTFARRCSLRGGRLLDVGAASGFFIALAQKYGWDASGVEISEFASRRARSRGLNVATGTIYLPELARGSYDAVSMLDVFEHVTNPEADIQRVRDLLKPGGIVIINTPDSRSAWARLWGIHWHLIIPPEHLFLFSRSSLETLLKRNGFTTLLYEKIGKSFSLPYIFRILHHWTSFGFFRWCAGVCERSFLKHLAFPINLRDNMLLVARKI